MAQGFATKRGRIPVTVLALCVMALVLSSCGRRGDPEAPPSAAVLATDEQGKVVSSDEKAVVDRPFILDGLIQ